MNIQFHEDLAREEPFQPASELSFGLMLTAVTTLLAILDVWHSHYLNAAGWDAATLLLAVVTLWMPKALTSASRVWTKLGLVMFKVVSPVIMLLFFAVAIIPTGMIMRFLGKDPLRLRFDRNAATYWISRMPPGPERASMPYQF